MTIKNLYPKSRPQTIYNVINGRPELPAASTFKRESIGTYVDAGGVIKTAVANEPRFTYDQETGEFLGLLLENEATNYLNGSNSGFGLPSNWDAYYSVSEATLSATQSPINTSPVGGQARRITYNGSTGGGSASQPLYQPKPPVGTRVSYSWYVRDSPDNSYITGLMMRVFSRNPGNNEECTARFNFIDKKVIQVGGAGANDAEAKMEPVGNGWYRISVTYIRNREQEDGGYQLYFLAGPNDVNLSNPSAAGEYYDITAPQVEYGLLTSWIPTTSAAVTRETDEFSLTSSSNFDGGFSLLLDSDTSTKDFLYKIKGTNGEVVRLDNNGGTLDWVITNQDGVEQSAKINGDYPQVGSIQPGRVRTVSSIGAADGTNQVNWLYTEGISFPTNAKVRSGANEIEFGTPQTLKALYLWSGQLSGTEAVSVIKGRYNILPNLPISGTAYSFVYNCDPTKIGETSITLPYIVPTLSMFVDWGDGSPIDGYSKGVTPSHTYPYPGQYRIQIEADDGFDSVRPTDVNNTIYNVDAWPPQYRDGVSPGFTGDDLKYILNYQSNCKDIPVFEYTDLTNIDGAFFLCYNTTVDGWNWIPRNLQKCKSMSNTFAWICNNVSTVAERDSFPQLQTSDELTDLSACMTVGYFTGWKAPDGSQTLFPWSNTSKVTYWNNALSNNRFTEIGTLDTSSATDVNSMFKDCQELLSLPALDVRKVKTFQNFLASCGKLTSLPAVGTNFKFEADRINVGGMFYNCTSLTSIPNYDWSNVISMVSTFQYTSVTTLPSFVSTANVTQFSAACAYTDLTEMPDWDTSSGNNFNDLFTTCRDLASLRSSWKFDKVIQMAGMFYNCPNVKSLPEEWNLGNVTTLRSTFKSNGFSVFPRYNLNSLGDMENAFNNSVNLVAWPDIKLPSLTYARNAFLNCYALATFPAGIFDDTGTLRPGAMDGMFMNCKLDADSIENILVSLVENGQSNGSLGLDSDEGYGDNADYSDWTELAKEKYAVLVRDRNWDIDINDSTNAAPFTMSATSGFYVNSQDGMVSFGELTAGTRHASGKADQEVFEDEGASVDRVLEVDENFFPDWDREVTYQIGDRVKFGDYVYRALQENDARSFELPDLEFNPDAVVATPANRQARWVEVYDPNYEEESIGGSI